MTKTIEQARREAFEAWIMKTYQSISFLNKDQYWNYETSWVEHAWLGYRAALDSLCIELPGQIGDFRYDQALYQCLEAIHAAGVKTK